MARQKDLLSRLADAGEEAIQRLSKAPGADQLTGALTAMRDRIDEMQKRLRGLDTLEKRLAALEKRVDALAGGRASSSRAGARGAGRARQPSKATATGGRDPAAGSVRRSGAK